MWRATVKEVHAFNVKGLERLERKCTHTCCSVTCNLNDYDNFIKLKLFAYQFLKKRGEHLHLKHLVSAVLGIFTSIFSQKWVEVESH